IQLPWMSIAADVAGSRHCITPVVTAAVHNVSFDEPIPLGSMVILEAWVTRAFSTSFEVYMEVFTEPLDGNRIKCNEAFFTFVALDKDTRKPILTPLVDPVNDRDKELYDGALRRRELRLIMAGRMKPEEAKNLMELFNYRS